MRRPRGFSLVFLVALSSALNFAQQSVPSQVPDPYKATLDHLESLVTQPVADWRFHTDVPHPEDPGLDDSAWPVITANQSRDDNAPNHWKGPRVFRRSIEIPLKINGYSTRGSRVKLNLAFGSDAEATITVFSNGSILFRGDEDMQQPILLTENAQPGEKYLVAARVDAGDVDTALFESALEIDPPRNRPDPSLMRDEVLSAIPLIAAYDDGKAERERELQAAVNAVDFSLLEHGDQNGFDASLGDAQKKLEALTPWMQQFTIRAVGNSHIDMAWLWPWTETVEVVRNTFESVLDLMREYPDFKFTMSSARAYEWMEEKYPDLFHEIEQRVKEGRWEVIGGMWVEPDLNMPAGESLVRQILVGKRYFQQKFGIDIKIGWNPDSFGYSWQLPQIYKKSGMGYFVTQKLLWAHEFTTFPYKLFWWEAPDGSRLLTYFPHDYAGGIDAESLGKDLSIWMPSIYGPQLHDTPEMMHLYGVGDHGGGPTRSMLDNAERLKSPGAVFPKLQFSTATAFFDDLNQKLPGMEVPTWKGELYFQYHRGVFTTQAETKKRIRHSEEALLNAEKFSSLAQLYGRPYPTEEFQLAWKNLLFDHFHDIMPGSGIAVNYLDAKRNLEDVERMSDEMTRGALGEISAHINTVGDGSPVVVYNTLSWPRTDVVQIEAQLPEPASALEVVDAKGQRASFQLLKLDRETHRATLLVRASVPALGYKIYFIHAVSAIANLTSSTLNASRDALENEFIRVKIDPATGCMTSLFDKRSQTEALAPAETDTGGPKDRTCGNLLQTFVDKPKQWDAWNIDADFEKQHWDLDKADEVKLIESGPLRAVIRIKNHFQNSTFVRDITLYAGIPRLDVKMHADWHEKHILLKVAFPLSVHSDKASFEIPFGSIERPTTRNTPAEKAQFEVPAQRWADISDDKHGFSLMNDCKYGYDAKGNVLRLSLLRSPQWPDPHADEGEHDFTYSLYPHGGTWQQAQTIRRGYELNYKLVPFATEKHAGRLPAEHAFLEVQPDNVIVTAIKKAEGDDSLVVRFFEWAGKATEVKLELPPGAEQASDTDLMERPTGPIDLKDGTASVETRPFEIKTLRVKFAPRASVSAARIAYGKGPK
jgi:alpha-mannosidase